MTNKDKKSLHVKTSDRVVVIAGKDKGKIGNVKKVDTVKGKVVVEGANLNRLPVSKVDLSNLKLQLILQTL